MRLIAMNTVDIKLNCDDMSIRKKHLSCWDENLGDFGPLTNNGPAVIFPGYLRQGMLKLQRAELSSRDCD